VSAASAATADASAQAATALDQLSLANQKSSKLQAGRHPCQ